MAVTMYNAVREFSSRWYPKKGKKGIGKTRTEAQFLFMWILRKFDFLMVIN
jgi:hypothetical protein